MTVTLGDHPRYLEELRIGGGYNTSPDGGADFDKAGNIAANGTLHLDGAATFANNLTVGGDFAITGVDTTWSVYLPATLGMPDPLLPCGPPTITNWRNYQVVTASLAFDPDAPQAAFFQYHLPPTYDGRPLTFTLEWSATNGTSGDVRWGVNPMGFEDGESFNQVGMLTYDISSFAGINTLHMMAIEVLPSGVDANNFGTIRILRDAGNAADGFDGEAKLLGVRVTF